MPEVRFFILKRAPRSAQPTVKKPTKGETDYRHLAMLCAHHASGNYYDVADNFADYHCWPNCKRLRLKRYIGQYVRDRSNNTENEDDE